MSHRDNQRGEGRLGLLLALAILGAGIFAGVKIIPVRITSYEFSDYIREQCRFAAVDVRRNSPFENIVRKAHDLEIPLDKKDLRVERTQSEMIISAKYSVPIDLKVMTYVYKFEHTERAPLF